MAESEDKGFTVRDRRSTEAEAGKETPKQGTGAARQERPGTEQTEQQRSEASSELDFSAFVISLATSAQVGLGSIPHPETKQTARNIPAAKQMIDILGMLKEKTKGNLAEAEQALLDQVLFNLRMHYVRTLEEQKKAGG